MKQNPDIEEYQEGKIKQLLTEMDSAYYSMANCDEEIQHSPDDYELQDAKSEYESLFRNLAKKLRIVCSVYIENKKLPEYFEKFKKTIDPFYVNRKELLSGSLAFEDMGVYSNLTFAYWNLLVAFPAFGPNNTEQILKRVGLTYLEHILESTQ